MAGLVEAAILLLPLSPLLALPEELHPPSPLHSNQPGKDQTELS